MTPWEELPESVHDTMSFLGEFNPTANKDDAQVRGRMLDPEDGGSYRVYLSSRELREIAADMCKVADWLDARVEPA